MQYIGNAVEYDDIAVFTSISMYISQVFTNQGIANCELIVWGVFTVRFLMRPFGGVVIGRYADKYGRRRTLVVCNILTDLATVAMALVPVSLLEPYIVVVFLLFQMVQAFAVIAMSAFIAMILGNMCAVLWDQCPNQTTSLGIGYNTALSIFGRLTPLIVLQLMEYGVAYVGVYVALATLSTLFIFVHEPPQEKLDLAKSHES